MNKTFDCVEMKQQGQELLRQRLAGMTVEQQRAFWAEESRKLRERQQSQARLKRPA